MTIRRISAVITVIRAVRASPLAVVHARTQRTLRKRESKTKLSLRRFQRSPRRNGLIATLHTPLWLASGLGCRGRCIFNVESGLAAPRTFSGILLLPIATRGTQGFLGTSQAMEIGRAH